MFLYVNSYYDFDLEWVCGDEESFDMFHDEDTAKIFWRRVKERAIEEGKRVHLEGKILLEVFHREEGFWKEVCELN